MLFKKTVDQLTFDLIIKLQEKPYLEGFYLVGGTALALRLGHRRSVDIDLFCNFNFDAQDIFEKISNDFNFKIFYSAANTLKGSINNVQVDILAHRYPHIADLHVSEKIKMLSIQDISAMKLNAVCTNGQRVKDFIDIFYILQQIQLPEMIRFYKTKYNQTNDINVLKSLVWFDDVDLADWPVMIKDPQLTWNKIKKTISDSVLKNKL